MRILEEARFTQEASRGDHEAIDALWRAHRRWVAAILLAHKPRGVELEDLLQEVAMKMVRDLHRLKDPASLRPWLRAVAVNAARTAGRRRKVRSVVRTTSDERALEQGVDADDRPDAQEDGRRLLELARDLPEAYREPLMLRAVRGLSYRQIADALELPITTVETRLARARRMLRDAMADAAPDGASNAQEQS
ncbi:sigma-70 family RNA polymerase sigma factor [Pyruvatibacter sp.]|uniref:RNA polymerase sigma factor n=1 Tax=Pyruvatibacter sp. TaxID=1981328 RepID=UPI0032ECE59C